MNKYTSAEQRKMLKKIIKDYENKGVTKKCDWPFYLMIALSVAMFGLGCWSIAEWLTQIN